MQRKIIPLGLLFSGLSLFASCAKPSTSTNASTESQTATDTSIDQDSVLNGKRFTDDVRTMLRSIIPGTADIPATLGNGYNSATQVLKSSCISGDVRYVGSMYSTNKIEHNLSSQDVINSLSGGLSGSIQYDLLFSGTASVDYSHELSNNEYSESFTDITEIGGKQIVLTNLKTSKLGSTLVNADGTVKSTIQNFCGDEFVNTVNVGAKLYLTIKFNFKNSLDKTTFQGSIGANITDLGNLTGKIAALDEATRKSFSVEISAYQLGGDSGALGKLFAPFTATTGALSILDCNADHLDKCEELIKHFEDYRISDFVTQVKNGYDPSSVNSLAVLSWQTAKYVDNLIANNAMAVRLIPQNTNPINMSAIEEKRRDLATAFNKESNNYLRASDILSSFQTNYLQRQALSDLQTNAQNNKNSIINAANVCWGSSYLTDCLSVAQDVLNKLSVYDSSVLNIFTGARVPSVNYTGYWQRNAHISSVNQIGLHLSLLETINDAQSSSVYSGEGSFVDDKNAYLSFNVTTKAAGLKNNCVYLATGKLTVINDKRFELQILVPNDTSEVKATHNSCGIPISNCEGGADRYSCLDIKFYSIFPI